MRRGCAGSRGPRRGAGHGLQPGERVPGVGVDARTPIRNDAPRGHESSDRDRRRGVSGNRRVGEGRFVLDSLARGSGGGRRLRRLPSSPDRGWGSRGRPDGHGGHGLPSGGGRLRRRAGGVRLWASPRAGARVVQLAGPHGQLGSSPRRWGGGAGASADGVFTPTGATSVAFDAYEADRRLFFGGVTATWLVVQFHGELAYAGGFDAAPEGAETGYDPSAGSLMASLAFRLLF